jgi:hypothetical protein
MRVCVLGWRNPRRLLLSFAAATLIEALPTETRSEPGPGFVGRTIRTDVERARAIALKKLQRPRCRLIFSDFTDSEGRTLQRNLDVRGETGASLLGRLSFYDGTGGQPCAQALALAFTKPGAGAVFVCGPAFRRALWDRMGLAANILLHEELHSLGLEESPEFTRSSPASDADRRPPPTSSDINGRVAARCGN